MIECAPAGVGDDSQLLAGLEAGTEMAMLPHNSAACYMSPEFIALYGVGLFMIAHGLIDEHKR